MSKQDWYREQALVFGRLAGDEIHRSAWRGHCDLDNVAHWTRMAAHFGRLALGHSVNITGQGDGWTSTHW